MRNKKMKRLIIGYLTQSIAEKEREVLLAWLKESEEHQFFFLSFYNIWELSNAKKINEEKAFKQFVTKNDELRKKLIGKRIRMAASIAACLAIVLVSTFLLMPIKEENMLDFVSTIPKEEFYGINNTTLILSNNETVMLKGKEVDIHYCDNSIRINNEQLVSRGSPSAFNQFVTPYGKRSTIVFSDGTKAWVNSGTILIYPAEFQKKKREIYVDGEILIEVAENKNRPFIVKTANMDVKVLGTKFNISAYEDVGQSSVVLVSGSVKITTKESYPQETLLKPNQIYTLNGENSIVQNTDANKHIMWVEGIYYFESMQLGDVLTTLSRYYRINIHFNETISGLTCSGKLEMKENPHDILDGLAYTMPIRWQQNEDKSYTVDLK